MAKLKVGDILRDLKGQEFIVLAIVDGCYRIHLYNHENSWAAFFYEIANFDKIITEMQHSLKFTETMDRLLK